MPFIRYTRDKRGYECTYVMHAYRTPQGRSETRVLYFFRTPAHVKMGREPLDAEVTEALEHTHPDLSFDWQALRREPVPARADERRRPGRRDERRAGRGQPREAPAIEIVDESVLARGVGAREAARLRRLYTELVERVTRRARTPEDRDRLLERLARLNPEAWPDEGAVRASATGVEAEWAAVAAELPARRRGRRGGRDRRPGPEPGRGEAAAADAAGPAPAGDEPEPGPSGIMAADGDSYEDGDDADAPEAGPDEPGGGEPDGPGGGGPGAAGGPAAAGVPGDR